MGDIQESLTTIEDLLVKEFRACQNLHKITQEEQRFLSSRDFQNLLLLVEQKESVLDTLNQLEEKLKFVASNLVKHINLPPHSTTLIEVLTVIDNEISERLRRLREGIVALLSVVRNLTYQNQTLAISRLDQLDIAQSFIFDIFRSYTIHNPSAKDTKSAPIIALDFEHKG
jgi:flagellar biosynthesis/type III secretory pathway chaperone